MILARRRELAVFFAARKVLEKYARPVTPMSKIYESKTRIEPHIQELATNEERLTPDTAEGITQICWGVRIPS